MPIRGSGVARLAVYVGMAALTLLGWSTAFCGEVDIVISHAKIISPPDSVIDDGTIAIDDGKIIYVGHGGTQFEARRSIDARGRAVIPGLIDTHVHLNIDPLPSQAVYDLWIDRRSGVLLQEYLRHGFTTVQSLGDYWPGVLQLREKVKEGKIPGPRLLVAGPLVTPPYGHAAAYSPQCAQLPFCRQYGWYREVADQAQARAVISDLAARGADAVKIANEQTHSPDGKAVGFAPGVLRTLIEEAHRHGLRVFVHPASVAYAVQAIQAGADVMAHGPGIEFFTPGPSPASNALNPLLTMAIERKVPISTTIVGPLGWMDAKTEAAVRADAKELFDGGVTLGFGTDSVGEAINTRREFEALARSGLTPMQILQIATLNAARELGLEKQIGSIEVGKQADLAIVAANPLQSVEYLDRIDMVIKKGTVAFDYYAEGADAL